jgi:hypothetical protein
MKKEKQKDLVKEHFDLQLKRDRALEMPMNSLTTGYIKSIGRSELENKLEENYEGFTFIQFLNQMGIK